MATLQDAYDIVWELPGTICVPPEPPPQHSDEPQGVSFQVNAQPKPRQFAWSYPERIHPKKPRVPNPRVLVIRVVDLADKYALIASAPDKFFNAQHYDDYKAVLARLQPLAVEELAELLTDAWRIFAPVDRPTQSPQPN